MPCWTFGDRGTQPIAGAGTRRSLKRDTEFALLADVTFAVGKLGLGCENILPNLALGEFRALPIRGGGRIPGDEMRVQIAALGGHALPIEIGGACSGLVLIRGTPGALCTQTI